MNHSQRSHHRRKEAANASLEIFPSQAVLTLSAVRVRPASCSFTCRTKKKSSCTNIDEKKHVSQVLDDGGGAPNSDYSSSVNRRFTLFEK